MSLDVNINLSTPILSLIKTLVKNLVKSTRSWMRLQNQRSYASLHIQKYLVKIQPNQARDDDIAEQHTCETWALWEKMYANTNQCWVVIRMC
jgi:hypothetical protein